MSRKIRVKPGKAHSVLGMVVGIIFVLLGVFLVIPTFGMFGVVWTLMAVAIACMNGYNAFSERGVVSSEIIIDDELPSPGAPEEGAEARLERLYDLYQRRVITQEEYERQRAQIISRL